MRLRLISAAIVLILLAAGLLQLRPPACKDDPGPTEFSCERALSHVKAIATVPHPADSPANVAARLYLLDQMRHLGLSPREQVSRAATQGRLHTMHNLIGRLPGTAPGPALMLACHYDSVPYGPGAGDDGAAVGALLEVVRAIRAGPPLRNELILLITDGEELGLFGARGLAEDDPLLNDVGLALNFDARGTAGPSELFETSPGNEDLVRVFASAAPAPTGTSLAYDIYRRMPNDTDFTIFKRAGIRGLNFAFIDNYVYYHTPQDTVANLDRRTLNQTGGYALSLTRAFGNADLAAIQHRKAKDAIFFNLIGRSMIVYPMGWIWPITFVLCMLTLAGLIFGFARKQISILGLIESLLRLVLSIAAGAGATWAIWRLASKALDRGWLASTQGFILRPSPTPTEITILVTAFAIITIVTTLLFAYGGHWRAREPDLAAAGAIAWTGAAIAATALLPGGSYLAAWPAIFAMIGRLLIEIPAIEMIPWRRAVIALIASAPAILMLPPSIVTFFTALTVAKGFVVAPLIVMTIWLLMTGGCVDLIVTGPKRESKVTESAV
ncbi:MAG TPA: M28 family peptidase [Humisphaera sp.]|jgi:hypothetical protein|nr:M28 family peptidase [Humisphaera sp.]